MPPELLVETLLPNGRWSRVGSCGPDFPPASVASEGLLGRDLYVFGWVDGRVGVYQSVSGVDYGNDAIRAVASDRLDRLSDLDEPYELVVNRPTIGAIRMRFSLVPSGGL